MAKAWDKDLQFVCRAIIVALIIMFGLQLLRPYVVPPDPKASEISAFAQKTVQVTAENVPIMLKASGRSTLVMVYASWCSYCRTLMPDLVALIREKKLSHVELMFLSLDNDPEELSRYLVHSGYENLFTPYIVADRMGLEGVMKQKGSAFNRSIPYLGLFDVYGNLVQESFGVIDKARLLALSTAVKG